MTAAGAVIKQRFWFLAVFCCILCAGELIAYVFYGRALWSHFTHTPFAAPYDLACFSLNTAAALHHTLPPAASAAGSCPFMYPPPFFLLTAPLGWFSPLWAYLLWSLAGMLALALAARAAKLSWAAIGLGLVSPPALYCLQAGQTGEIISALLLLCLALAETNPVIAGIATGCLLVKPQFALLLPVCFLAAGNWRAIIAAGLSTSVVALFSVWVFGAASWQHFLADGVPVAHAVLERPWPVAYQGIMISVFMTLRSLGANLPLAYAVQFAATLGAAVAAWYLWRPRTQVEPLMRLLLTLCLVPLATPYAYIYDIPGIALVLAAPVLRRRGQYLVPLALFWLITASYILIAMFSFLTGGVFLVLLVARLWPQKEKAAAF